MHCFRPVCAPTKFPVSGKCVPLFKYSRSLAKDYRIAFPLSEDLPDLDGLRSIVEDVFHNVTSALNGSDVNICDIYVSLNGDYVVLHALVMGQGFEDIEEEFQLIKSRLKTLSTMRTLILDPYQEFSAITLNRFTYVKYAENKYERGDCSNSGVAMVDAQFCDAISFSVESTDLIIIGGFVFEPHEYVITSTDMSHIFVHICLDTLNQKIGNWSKTVEDNTVNDLSQRLDPDFLVVAVFGIYTCIFL